MQSMQPIYYCYFHSWHGHWCEWVLSQSAVILLCNHNETQRESIKPMLYLLSFPLVTLGTFKLSRQKFHYLRHLFDWKLFMLSIQKLLIKENYTTRCEGGKFEFAYCVSHDGTKTRQGLVQTTRLISIVYGCLTYPFWTIIALRMRHILLEYLPKANKPITLYSS